MNGLLEGVIIALVPLGIIQIGALVYFCGVVATTLRDHGERISRIEDWREGRQHSGRYAGEGVLS